MKLFQATSGKVTVFSFMYLFIFLSTVLLPVGAQQLLNFFAV